MHSKYKTVLVLIRNIMCFLKRKIKLLERKLLEEEHERKLVQEKAEEVWNPVSKYRNQNKALISSAGKEFKHIIHACIWVLVNIANMIGD